MSRAVERWQPTPWAQLQEEAKVLARSAFVPDRYKGKPDDVLAAGLYAQEIGLGICAALSYINVIQGRPTLSAEGMVALVRSKGNSISGKSTDQAAEVTGKRADTGDTMTVEWTIGMAERAGLLKNATWKQYPEAMLWARAVSQLCRMLFPDVLAGLSYTPEELTDAVVMDVPAGTTRRAGDHETPALVPADAVAAEEESSVPASAATSEPPPRWTPPGWTTATQAGPPGMGDQTTWINTGTGEQTSDERAALLAWLVPTVKDLGDLRDRLAAERLKAGLPITKTLNSHTVEELRRLGPIVAGIVAEEPF